MRTLVFTLLFAALFAGAGAAVKPGDSPSAASDRIIYRKMTQMGAELVVLRGPDLPIADLKNVVVSDQGLGGVDAYFSVRIELRIPQKPPVTLAVRLIPVLQKGRASGFDVLDSMESPGEVILVTAEAGFIFAWRVRPGQLTPIQIEGLRGWSIVAAIDSIDGNLVKAKLSRTKDNLVQVDITDLRGESQGHARRTRCVQIGEDWTFTLAKE